MRIGIGVMVDSAAASAHAESGQALDAPIRPQATEVQPGQPAGTRGQRRICKTIRRTGSRLAVTRFRKSVAEWDALRQLSRVAAERRQRPMYNRSTCAPGGR